MFGQHPARNFAVRTHGAPLQSPDSGARNGESFTVLGRLLRGSFANCSRPRDTFARCAHLASLATLSQGRATLALFVHPFTLLLAEYSFVARESLVILTSNSFIFFKKNLS